MTIVDVQSDAITVQFPASQDTTDIVEYIINVVDPNGQTVQRLTLPPGLTTYRQVINNLLVDTQYITEIEVLTVDGQTIPVGSVTTVTQGIRPVLYTSSLNPRG